MSSPPWMPLYVGDYLADTGHLTAAQHGAYLMLIMHYWRMGGLPKADDALARIARMTPEEWNGNRIAIASFFTSEWHHKRIDFELKQAQEIASARTEAGKAGAKARWGKKKRLNGKRNADAIAKRCPSPSPSPIEESKKDSEATPLPQAAVPTPLDFKKELWARGVPYLKTCGLDEGQARSMIGKWRKSHGDSEVLLALAAAEGGAVSQPVPYIQQVLNGKAKANGHGRHTVGDTLKDIARDIAAFEDLQRR